MYNQSVFLWKKVKLFVSNSTEADWRWCINRVFKYISSFTTKAEVRWAAIFICEGHLHVKVPFPSSNLPSPKPSQHVKFTVIMKWKYTSKVYIKYKYKFSKMDFGWPIITAALTGRLLEKKAKKKRLILIPILLCCILKDVMVNIFSPFIHKAWRYTKLLTHKWLYVKCNLCFMCFGVFFSVLINSC